MNMVQQGPALRTVEGTTVPEAGTYEIDPSHSVVEFVVRHLGLAKVRGRFNDFDGVIEIADDVMQSKARATIQAASIDTRNEDRDQHLRTADFLNVENEPTLEFRTTGVRHEGGEWYADGELSIAGTSRPVTLDVEFEGSAKDPWDNVRVAFSATTKVNREDYGLTWNQALEGGGWLVGKEVRIELSAEAIKQA
jgi:polyisoprenoid-binding protein YceI